jgi:hypothetical protein
MMSQLQPSSDPRGGDRGGVPGGVPGGDPARDPFDRLLTASLSARPEPATIANLAQRAIGRARSLDRLADQQRRKLVIHRWRLRFTYTAAALLICVLILLGGNRLRNEASSMTSTDSSISSTDSSTPGTSTYVLWLGGFLFICTLAGLAAESAIGSGRQSLVV